MTIEQVQEDIKSGKCKRIYYAAHTLWWTHLEEDLIQARAQGRKAQEIRNQKLLNDPNVPESEKERFRGLFKLVANSITPLDPSGSPLYQTDDVNDWVDRAIKLPTHFGRHGLAAFMKAHHQNCGGICSARWEDYNLMCDKN